MIDIDTHQFEIAHGKKPRGVGQWIFRFAYKKSPLGFSFEELDAPPMLSYGHAKKWAVEKARELNAITVAVCS